MLVDALYENGRVVLTHSYRFAHKRFPLKVDLPDIEVIDTHLTGSLVNNSTNSGEAAEFRALTDALFDETYQYVPNKSDKEILIDELSKKYA